MIRMALLMLALFAAMPVITGCQAVEGLTDAERAQVSAGERAVVLLRIRCVIDGVPCEPFGEKEFATTPLFMFGLGSFETVGEPEQVVPRFLPLDSERGGWICFVLAPGTYHIAVLGPGTNVMYGSSSLSAPPLLSCPRWRVDVPEGAGVVDAGTIRVEGRSIGEYLFGGRMIEPVPEAATALREDDDEVRRIAARHFPEAASIRFAPLQRWRPGDPKVITTPRGTERRGR